MTFLLRAASLAWRKRVHMNTASQRPPPRQPAELAGFIDHTLLKPEADAAAIRKLCAEARTHKFFAVCVNGAHVRLAAEELRDSGVAVASVVGFPLGAMSTIAKAREAELAAHDGAREIDMVMRIDLAKSGVFTGVRDDIREVVRAVEGQAIVKVILETGLLSLEEISRSCRAAEEAGAHFVKTCTGFSTGAASVEHIALMRDAVSDRVQVKASGGIRSWEQARDLILAGADRLGTSSGVQLVQAIASTGGY